MSVKSVAGRSPSKFDLGDKVKTPSGLIGEIIGLAEFANYWEYRIKVPGRLATMYRHEHKLTLVMRGTKARRDYLTKQGKKKTRARRSSGATKGGRYG
jgi:hypothetical protein